MAGQAYKEYVGVTSCQSFLFVCIITVSLSFTCHRFFCPPPCVYLLGDGWQYRQSLMPPMQEEEAMHHPVAFIGIGSKNEQEMQQLLIEDKVRIYFTSEKGQDQLEPWLAWFVSSFIYFCGSIWENCCMALAVGEALKWLIFHFFFGNFEDETFGWKIMLIAFWLQCLQWLKIMLNIGWATCISQKLNWNNRNRINQFSRMLYEKNISSLCLSFPGNVLIPCICFTQGISLWGGNIL